MAKLPIKLKLPKLKIKPKSIIPIDRLSWQIETYQWLFDHVGDRFRDRTYQLIEPTESYFPDRCSTEEEVFIKTFERVKSQVGLDSWPCKLEPQNEDIETRVSATLNIQNVDQGPAGTFRYHQHHGAVITYNPNLVNDIQSLVATYAHELGHYLTANVSQPPPGGWEIWEPATDLTAVFMGYGIFMANSAFVFSQYSDVDSQGWSTKRQGYLTSTELVNALAIFVLLRAIPSERPLKHLKPTLKAQYRKAVRFLGQSQMLVRLRS